jgi:hypothetical protein
MAGKRVSTARRVAWSIGAIVLLSAFGVSCTTGGGGGCGRPTQIFGGYPNPNPPAGPVPGWYSADTRLNGNVTVDGSYGAPAGFGCYSALMTTGASTPTPSQDKAQLFSYAKFGTPFASIHNVGYWSDRVATSGPAVDIALNVELYGIAGFTGTCTMATPCFTTLVYEPYQQSAGQGAIVDGQWQHWDATDATPGNGVWWSTHIGSGQGSQAQPMPWSWFQGHYSDAVVGAYGFNIGSVNPNMVVAGDGLTFGSTTTNF